MFLGGDNPKIADLQLKISLWFVTHKLLLKKILIGTLIGVSVLLYGFSIIGAVKILVYQKGDYEALMASLSLRNINYEIWREAQKPADLQLLELKILNSTEGRKDIVAMAKNPNSNFIIKKLKYQFVKGDEILAENETYLWLDEIKPLVAFGVEGVSNSSDVQLQVADISWWRIKKPQEFKDFIQSRLQFNIKDIKYQSPRQSPVNGKLPHSQVTFTVTNQSIFDYWEVGFYVILYSGTRIVGAHYIEEEQFKSLETRQVSVSWFNSLPSVNRVEVIPELNVLDQGVYMEKGMVTGELK
jgi:hypothetical protein